MAVHAQFPVSTTPSESQRLNQVPFEEGALADVASDHLLRLVPGMLHDVALVGAPAEVANPARREWPLNSSGAEPACPASESAPQRDR